MGVLPPLIQRDELGGKCINVGPQGLGQVSSESHHLAYDPPVVSILGSLSGGCGYEVHRLLEGVLVLVANPHALGLLCHASDSVGVILGGKSVNGESCPKRQAVQKLLPQLD